MSGLRSIPRTHQGEHLAYISPQEAQMLRQQGGGVASDGGQLRGPGGIPSFRGAPQLNPEQKAWASNALPKNFCRLMNSERTVINA